MPEDKDLFVVWQEAHKDLCPDPDEDTPVACDMNPHWNQLQERSVNKMVCAIVIDDNTFSWTQYLSGLFSTHMLLSDNKEI